MTPSDVLADAGWVQAHLDDPRVVPVEVDGGTSAYDKGHLKGAVRLDWNQDLQDPETRGFVDEAGFQRLLSARGISNDDTVILYGGNNNWFAAYAYWYFKVYGHHSVRLLDGGREKWELDSREMVTEVPRRAATAYRVRKPEPWIRMVVRARSQGMWRAPRHRWPWQAVSSRFTASGRRPGERPLARRREFTGAR
jgi:thiosulfate/3-mercaptopyruvate sulfurtransferase